MREIDETFADPVAGDGITWCEDSTVGRPPVPPPVQSRFTPPPVSPPVAELPVHRESVVDEASESRFFLGSAICTMATMFLVMAGVVAVAFWMNRRPDSGPVVANPANSVRFAHSLPVNSVRITGSFESVDKRIVEEDALVLGNEATEATDHKTSLAIVAQDPIDELSTPISADPVATETLETIPRLAKRNGEEFVSIDPAHDPLNKWLAIEPAMNEDAAAECQVARNLGTKLIWAESPNQAAVLANEKEKLVYLIQVSGNFEIPEFT